MKLYSARDGLYKKVKDAVSIIVTMITILVGLGNFLILNDFPRDLLIPIGLSLTCLFVGALFCGRILYDNESVYDDPLHMLQKWENEDVEYIITKLSATWADAVNINRAVHNSKANDYRWVLNSVGVGLLSLIGGFLIHIYLLFQDKATVEVMMIFYRCIISF